MSAIKRLAQTEYGPKPMTTQQITKILLSLWTSTKTVERLPRVTEWHPWQTVAIVPMSPSARYEGI